MHRQLSNHALPLDGGGSGWGCCRRKTRSAMKKQPSEGAHERAQALRREMTEAERRLWQMLRSRQTEGHRFRRQVPIGRFIADFVCHEARLIVKSMAASTFLRPTWRPVALGSWIVEKLRRRHPHPNPPPSKGEGWTHSTAGVSLTSPGWPRAQNPRP
jgi:Protein of unknown function (DUF559)